VGAVAPRVTKVRPRQRGSRTPFPFCDETDANAWAWRERAKQSTFEITARVASWQSVRAGEVAVLAGSHTLVKRM
jgi:hypothetical protein